jgi:hypothetical protein
MIRKYTVRAYYPDAVYLPDGSIFKVEAVLSPIGMEVNKQPLIPTVDRLLKGEHDQVFGSGLGEERILTAGFPEYVQLKVED